MKIAVSLRSTFRLSVVLHTIAVKTLITYLALAGFTLISVASVVRAVRSELDRPPAFDAAALSAWLVAPTRENETEATLRRAARQLEQEFHDQVDRGPEYEALDSAARANYETNWRRLLLTLVGRHADDFAATPVHQRDAFVGERLAQYGTWYGFRQGKKEQATEFLSSSMDKQEARSGIDPKRRERIRDLVNAVRQYPLKKFLERMLPADAKPRTDGDDR